MNPHRSAASSPVPVAIASCAAVAGTDVDDLRVIAALGRHGVAAAHLAWDDPAVDWRSFDLVVVRSTWDYPERHEHFLTWAAGLRRVLNPLPVLRWNTDKRYLDDLARAGLPVIPTRFLEPGAAFDPPSEAFVVKPAISCGAKQTARYRVEDAAAAREHVRQLHAAGRTVMVQPYLADIEAQGEIAVMFVDGAFSHAIRRAALLTHPGRQHAGEMTPSKVQPHAITPAERALAERALAQVPGHPADVLYARIDLAPGPGGAPLVLEVEVTEPSLFLDASAEGVERLAAGIRAALAGRP